MNDQPLEPLRSIPAYDAMTQPRKSPWKRLIGLGVAVLVVIGLIVGGTLYWLSVRDLESTDDAEIDAYTTQMAPQVSGRVTELLIADNQHVTAGQVLLRIDPRDYQAKLDLAKARAANARAQVEHANAMVAVQQANVDQALANVQVQQSDLVQAQQDYERYRGIDPRSVTRQSIDNATATFHGAQARLAAAQQTVTADRAQVKSAQAQVLAAQAAVQQEDANVASAALQLTWCTIVAPVTGIVGHRSVDVGNYVAVGQPLFALVQDGRWITANFKETQLARMHPGQPVDITIDAVPSLTFQGKLDSFQPGTGAAFSALPAENATGNYVKIVQRVPVKILFDDDRVKDYPLMPGMSVEPSVRVR